MVSRIARHVECCGCDIAILERPKRPIVSGCRAIANIRREAWLPHAFVQCLAPPSLLVIATVTIRLGELKPLVQVLTKAEVTEIIDPLPSCAFVPKRCDTSACRVKPHLEELILQSIVVGGR